MSTIPSLAKANCVTCRKVLDASWAFCPACGADNRDPAFHHGSVGQHDHNFSFGVYCVLCGHSSGSSADRIVIANDPGLRAGGVVCILLGVVFPLYALVKGWFNDPGTPKFLTMYGIVLLALAFAALGVYLLLAESTIIFELRARTITLKSGLTVAPKVETLGFDQFGHFRLTSRQRDREVTPTWFLDLIGRDGRVIQIANYAWESKMRAGVDDFIRRTGLPLDDQSSR